MTFVVALLSWLLLSIPAALILGRILAGTVAVADRQAPAGLRPRRSAPQPFARS